MGAVFSGAASAELVSITNASFETLPASGFNNFCGGSCAYTTGTPIPGWIATGNGAFGQLIMGGYNGNPGATDGVVMAYSEGATLSQDVGVASAGTTYTLSVDLLHRTDAALAGSIELLVNGTAVAGTITSTDPGPGQWTTFVETYTAGLGDDGKTLTIGVNSSGSQGDYDNVRLDATPEPGTIALLGSALAGLGLLLRNTRKTGGVRALCASAQTHPITCQKKLL